VASSTWPLTALSLDRFGVQPLFEVAAVRTNLRRNRGVRCVNSRNFRLGD
jgi:hypothetical protein